MDFGEKLKKLRREAGMTQDELSNRLFVSRTAVSKWETGRGLPAIDTLKAIADLFGVTVDDLVSHEDVRKEKSSCARREKLLTVSAIAVFAAAAALCVSYCFFKSAALLAAGCAAAGIYAIVALCRKPRHGAASGGLAAKIIPKAAAAALVFAVAAITLAEALL